MSWWDTIRLWMLGPRRYEYDTVREVTRSVHLPEGGYAVTLMLQRCRLVLPGGQTVGRTWWVEWESHGPGIPTEGPLRGRVGGSGVEVSNDAVERGTWPAEACARIGLQIAEIRTAKRWEPTGRVPVTL